MLLLNFTGLGTFPDKERTQAKTARFCLYLTELDLELAIRGDGRQSERSCRCGSGDVHFPAGGRTLPELLSQEAERNIFGDGAASLS